MSARDYFEDVRAAQRGIDRTLALMESMRERERTRAQRYDLIGRGKGPGADPMAATDARIDWERAHPASELARLEAEVADGRRVCAGVRAANPRLRWADALEWRYCEDRSWQEVAALMGVSVRCAHADAAAALDWVDMVGVAAARGMA